MIRMMRDVVYGPSPTITLIKRNVLYICCLQVKSVGCYRINAQFFAEIFFFLLIYTTSQLNIFHSKLTYYLLTH